MLLQNDRLLEVDGVKGVAVGVVTTTLSTNDHFWERLKVTYIVVGVGTCSFLPRDN